MYHDLVSNNAPIGHKLQAVKLTEAVYNWQIKFLKSFFKIVSLEDYCKKLKEKQKIPYNTIAITFDDGTSMTYNILKKSIEKYNYPATIFVTTCQIDNGQLIFGAYINALCYEGIYDFIRLKNKTLILDSKENKLKSRKELYEIYQKEKNKKKFYEYLLLKYPINSKILKYYQGIKGEQLNETQLVNNISIGSHTHSHPILSNLNHSSQLNEIKKSKTILENKTKKKITIFAYPSGEYNTNTIDILQSLGFKYSFAVKPKKIGFYSDNLYEIPRFGVYQKTNIGFILFIIKSFFKNLFNV